MPDNAINLISIVIPALNEEKLLAGCLESLQNQDYTGRYEIVIADNGSTDRTVDIARSFGLRIVHCPEKRSVFYARKAGADAVHGDIIIQADADTLYPREWLKKIVRRFVDNPNVVAVTGKYFYRDPPNWAWLEYLLRHILNLLSPFFLHLPVFISGATFAFRRSSFLAVNGYEGITYSADQYGITERLKRQGKIIYDSQIVVFTSARTVQKPFSVIIGEALHNFRQWFFFQMLHFTSKKERVTKKLRANRVAAAVSIPLICLILLLLYGYYAPAAPVFGGVYYKGESDEMVALTFDDGPYEPYTSQVLDILDQFDVKSTFFLIGREVELYTDAARRILSEGHVIGNHSYSHHANHALSEYGAKDMDQAQIVISTLLGVNPNLYRPPNGRKTPWELQSIKEAGMVTVTWSISTRDSYNYTAQEMVEEIVDKTGAGEIVRLQDGYDISGSDKNEQSHNALVNALPEIIRGLQAKGYHLVTVPELLQVPAYNN